LVRSWISRNQYSRATDVLRRTKTGTAAQRLRPSVFIRDVEIAQSAPIIGYWIFDVETDFVMAERGRSIPLTGPGGCRREVMRRSYITVNDSESCAWLPSEWEEPPYVELRFRGRSAWWYVAQFTRTGLAGNLLQSSHSDTGRSASISAFGKALCSYEQSKPPAEGAPS